MPVTITLREANAYVHQVHRHNSPLPGAKFAVAAVEPTGDVRGVAIAGVPKSIEVGKDPRVLEVNRVCTEGYRNACSFLYGCCIRAGRAMGYWRIITYTLPEESGASLKASGWTCDGPAGGASTEGWMYREGRVIGNTGPKLRWSIRLAAQPPPALSWPVAVTLADRQYELPMEEVA